MYDVTLAETVTIRGDGGDEIEAYLSCPLLGLFGADDQYPSPDQVSELV
jgi:hypothetical protein